MTRKISVCFVFLLTAAISWASVNSVKAQSVTPSKAKPSKTLAAPANGIVTAAKPTYTLHLNSNPTTGYSWFVLSYPTQFVKVIKHQFIPPNTKLVGAGGTSVWQFKVTKLALSAPTVIPVKMIYARPWSLTDDSTAQTFYIVTSG